MKKKRLILTLSFIIVVIVIGFAISYKKFIFASNRYYGKTVFVDYTAKFANGQVFDTSLKEIAQKNGIYHPNTIYTPSTFTIGSRSGIPEIENAIKGMAIGESKTITVQNKSGSGGILIFDITLVKVGK